MNLPFAYSVVRSARRKSACIQIKNAQVTLRAPVNYPTADLLAFAASKSSWILAKLDEQQTRLAAAPVAPIWDTDSLLPFMGEKLRLVVQEGSFNAVARMGDTLMMVINKRGKAARAEKIHAQLVHWYSDEALRILSIKTHSLAANIGRRVTQVTIKATKTKWGHCTRGGAIQYNWQILLAPEPVVDYLVAHEVSHLIHHDHSPAFWAQVAQLCPDFLALRRWLKQQGTQLVL